MRIVLGVTVRGVIEVLDEAWLMIEQVKKAADEECCTKARFSAYRATTTGIMISSSTLNPLKHFR